MNSSDEGFKGEQHSKLGEYFVVIESPREGDVITEDITELRGYAQGLPSGQTLHVLAVNRYGWFVQWPPPHVDDKTGAFSARNVRLAGDTEDEWELHVVSAGPEANQLFESRARMNDWESFPYLPKGCKTIGSVRVHRAKSGEIE